MNSTVVNLESDKSNCDSIECHLMPCKIEHKGSTILAKEYFWPTIRPLSKDGDEQQGRDPRSEYLRKSCDGNKVDDPILVASFRGRPLQGKRLDLPDGYEGSVVIDSKKPARKFNSFTYWNWDEIPSANDNIVKALQWIDIAEAIHAPAKI